MIRRVIPLRNEVWPNGHGEDITIQCPACNLVVRVELEFPHDAGLPVTCKRCQTHMYIEIEDI